MGKKKKDIKKKLKKAILAEKAVMRALSCGNCKSKCCKKYKKCESKRCKRCPCVDLLKKVA